MCSDDLLCNHLPYTPAHILFFPIFETISTIPAKQSSMAKLHENEHSHIPINGLDLHIAQLGKGELGTLVFLHGFPEIWYSWRHQMVAVADAGYRAIAPDFRGYGLSGQPADIRSASMADLVAHLLAIIDFLTIPKVFIVAKDFGAKPAYVFALHHPDRVLGVITMGVPYSPKSFTLDSLPEGFYVSRWREPGRAEADFGRLDAKTVVRNIYILFSKSEIPIAAEGQEIMDLVDPFTPLPPWFSEEDLAAYGALYENSGFRYPLQVPYRTIHQKIVDGEARVQVPALLIMGEADYVMKFPGMEDYVRSGMVRHFVPDLEIAFVPGGTHFVQEQFPDLVNELILNFLRKHV